MKLNRLAISLVAAVVASLVATTAVSATDCTASNYPPGCTPVGTGTPAPTVVNLTTLAQIGSVTTSTFAMIGSSTPVVLTSVVVPSAGTSSISIPASATGGAVVKLSISSTAGVQAQQTLTDQNGSLAVSVTGFDPGTTVGLYLHSAVKMLGTIKVTGSSSHASVVKVPANTVPGNHFIEFSGMLKNGNKLSVLMPIKVIKAKIKVSKNSKNTYVAFRPNSAALTTTERTHVNQFIAGIPKKAKTVKVDFVSNYSTNLIVALARGKMLDAIVRAKLGNAKDTPVTVKKLSKVSVFSNTVFMAAAWK